MSAKEVKLICFDLDGVLVKLKHAHYKSLNDAIENVAGIEYIITEEEHISVFDGLSTKTKLHKLVDTKKLDKNLINEIFYLKQKYTIEAINELIKPNLQLRLDLLKLKAEGYKLFVCSNAIRDTIDASLSALYISGCFDYILANEDVEYQKPNPQIYLKAMVAAGVSVKETLIIEDSKNGKLAASLSGAFICDVDDTEDVCYDLIKKNIIEANLKQKIQYPVKNKVNVLIPMSGAGSRFAKEGFVKPKPLIDVNGTPMIKMVVDNMNVDATFTFIVQKQHKEQYMLDIILPLIAPGCNIVETDKLTRGAAESCLLAKDYIDNDKHLFIINSDQYIEWNSSDFFYTAVSNNYDGMVLTFNEPTRNPKWSFVREHNGFIVDVKEKEAISDIATVGGYYFNKGSDFVEAAEAMIQNNETVNGEFYVAPTYNYLINQDKKIKSYNIENFYGTGTPEDLKIFLNKK